MLYLEEIKKLIKGYDDGILTESEVEIKVFESSVDGIINVVKNNKTIHTAASCCCSSHPPDETYKIKITKKPHQYIVEELNE